MSRARSLSLIANESAVTVINDTLNVGIARLNSDLNDSTVLRDHYASIALPAFQDGEDDSEKSAEA